MCFCSWLEAVKESIEHSELVCSKTKAEVAQQELNGAQHNAVQDVEIRRLKKQLQDAHEELSCVQAIMVTKSLEIGDLKNKLEMKDHEMGNEVRRRKFGFVDLLAVTN